jgi:streptomycin 6-kinase
VIDTALARNAVRVWGAAGARWLERLPRLVEDLARDWDLALGAPFDLSFHFVIAVTVADGTPAVLKLGVPGEEGLRTEVPALRAFAGGAAVRVLDADLTRGAVLLERVVPGRRLRELVPARDVEATAVAAAVIRRLHVPPPPDCSLPEVSSHLAALDDYLATHGDRGPLPAALVVRAAGVMRELRVSSPDPVVLHGDLHHDNILSATREPWLAIDPHGLVGDPGYDIGSLLYNPCPADRDPSLTGLVPARAEHLADALAMPLDRVVAWGFVTSVLSEVWNVPPTGPPPPATRALDVANLLLPRLG